MENNKTDQVPPSSEVWVKVSKDQLNQLTAQLKAEREHRQDLERLHFMMMDLVGKFGVNGKGETPSMMAIANAVFKSKKTVEPFMDTINEINLKYYPQNEPGTGN